MFLFTGADENVCLKNKGECGVIGFGLQRMIDSVVEVDVDRIAVITVVVIVASVFLVLIIF